MFKWLLKKWFMHSPTCNCGWTMKQFVEYSDRYQWKCLWKNCGWEAFQDGNGKLHWWK